MLRHRPDIRAQLTGSFTHVDQLLAGTKTTRGQPQDNLPSSPANGASAEALDAVLVSGSRQLMELRSRFLMGFPLPLPNAL
jgi:hypothetical protein